MVSKSVYDTLHNSRFTFRIERLRCLRRLLASPVPPTVGKWHRGVSSLGMSDTERAAQSGGRAMGETLIVEVAVSGQADALVTGNVSHFTAGENIAVMTPASFLEFWVKRRSHR